MSKIRCMSCAGSGKVMGGGMMMWDCDDCDGQGKRHKTKDEQVDEAVKEIQKFNDISYDDAKKIFDEELAKKNPILKDEKNAKPERNKSKE